MEQKEMLALLKSQMHMTYAERNGIAAHMKAMSKRLHQQEAEIEKLVQERGTMRASSPTMEWISVEDRLPEENGTYLIAVKGSYASHFTGFDIESNEFCDNVFRKKDITHWMPLPEPPQPKMPTFKDVFLAAFPKTKLLDGGTPVVCAKGVFPQIGDFDDCCNGICRECWNQPYFEPKEEGEADA